MKIFVNAFIATAIFISCQAKADIETERPATDTITSGQIITSQKQKFKVAVLDSSLKNPWGLTWLPDGRMLVTERSGQILVFKNDKNTGEKLTGVPTVYENGQGGLLDIALHPKYAENGWIYISYSKPGNNGGGTTIIRAKLKGNALIEKQELFSAQPFVNSGAHFGSRIIFDKNAYLYFTSGERGTKENAQTLSNDLGKVHRLYDDGRIPADNPFVNTAGAKPSIWSYGHRNPQGLVYDAAHDLIWEVEHGPKGGDELNIVEKGKNYGWPVITYGIDYNGSKISDITSKEGMEQPVHYWVPSIATCGMALITSDRYPGWKGNLMVGGLALQHIARIELDGRKYKSGEKLLDGYARVRQIGQSPDGYIYVLMEGRGRLIKLVPEA